MITTVLQKDGSIKKLYYYELEEFCEVVIMNYLNEKEISAKEKLEREKRYLQFQKDYHTFLPYFDFVFTELQYTLYNPCFIMDSVLKGKKENLYYLTYLKQPSSLSLIDQFLMNAPFLPLSKEESIMRIPIMMHEEIENTSSFMDGFINEDLEIIRINHFSPGHNNIAKLWIHNLLIKDKEVCRILQEEKKRAEDLISFDYASLLMQIYPWIRLFISDINENHVELGTIYNPSVTNELQNKLIKKLKENNFLKEELETKIS